MSSTLGHFVIPQRIFLAWMPSINKKCHQNHFLGLVEITGGKLRKTMSKMKQSITYLSSTSILLRYPWKITTVFLLFSSSKLPIWSNLRNRKLKTFVRLEHVWILETKPWKRSKSNFYLLVSVPSFRSIHFTYTGFLLYREPYLLTGKCKYTKSKSEIYSTSVPFLPNKICNDEKSLLFASSLKLPHMCGHIYTPK